MTQRRTLRGACGRSRSPLVSLATSLAALEPRACLERAASKGEGSAADNSRGTGRLEGAQTHAASKGDGARRAGARSAVGRVREAAAGYTTLGMEA